VLVFFVEIIVNEWQKQYLILLYLPGLLKQLKNYLVQFLIALPLNNEGNKVGKLSVSRGKDITLSSKIDRPFFARRRTAVRLYK